MFGAVRCQSDEVGPIDGNEDGPVSTSEIEDRSIFCGPSKRGHVPSSLGRMSQRLRHGDEGVAATLIDQEVHAS